MKLILQIALGVYLGFFASQITLQFWLDYKNAMAKQSEDKYRVDREKIRVEHSEKIRTLILEQQRKQNLPGKFPPGFVPDDAR